MLLGALIVAFVVVWPLSAAVMEALEGRHGWRGWRWLYLVFGVSGVGASIVGWIFLPDYPEGIGGRKKRRFWMSEKEFEVARLRIEEDRVGEMKVESRRVWNGLREAVRDKRTWIFVSFWSSRASVERAFRSVRVCLNFC